MPLSTADEVYEQVVRPLPLPEQERLVEKITDAWVSPPNGDKTKVFDWMALRGIAPNLRKGECEATDMNRKWAEIKGSVTHPLCGEDAQDWISRSRRESDEHREQVLGR